MLLTNKGFIMHNLKQSVAVVWAMPTNTDCKKVTKGWPELPRACPVARILFKPWALLYCLFTLNSVAEETVDPNQTGRQYAWSENGGWINAEPSGDGGPGLDFGTGVLKGWLWSENFGWISLNCTNTDSCATVDFRVSSKPVQAQPDHYTFSGYGWGENIGWVSFNCENTSNCTGADYRVVATASGALSGYAWSENAGWLSFNCLNTDSCDTVDYFVATALPVPLIFKDSFESQ